jgi:UDP:flavonoid glycosyltransferase YjiC (YdhE family)
MTSPPTGSAPPASAPPASAPPGSAPPASSPTNSGPPASGHIAVFNIPALGHVNPTLALVAELTRRGHRVSYTSIEARTAVVESVGARLVPYLSSRPADTQLLPPAPGRAEYLADNLLSFLAEAELTLPQVEPVFDADRPDLVVYDRLSFAGRIYAAKRGIPAVQSWPMLVSNEHWSLFRDFAPFDAGHPTFLSYLAKLDAFLAEQGVAVSARDFLTEPAPVLHLCWYPRSFQYCGELFDDRYRFVGPCPRPAGPACWRPPAGTRVVLASLGTIDNLHPDFYLRCIEAFGDPDPPAPDPPAPDPLAPDPPAPGWHAVLAVGQRLDPAALGPVPANIEVQQVVPQPQILAHAAALVCHAGLNSVMEALLHGVPLVLAPRTLEQESNADRVVQLGLGARLDPDGLTAARLRETVDRVAADPDIARRIDALREEMRAAGGAAAAADAIEAALGGGWSGC